MRCIRAWRPPGESAFAFIGVSGEKEITDDTLIAGPDSVQYTGPGQRADSSGPLSSIYTVNFGRPPGGGFTASVAREGIHAPAADGATPSTADGRTVQKVLPNGNGRARRERTRR